MAVEGLKRCEINDLGSTKKEIKEDEGVVNGIYLNHLGNPTFGVGHLIRESDPEHGLAVGTPVSE